jgi:hypothetical protein
MKTLILAVAMLSAMSVMASPSSAATCKSNLQLAQEHRAECERICLKRVKGVCVDWTWKCGHDGGGGTRG